MARHHEILIAREQDQDVQLVFSCSVREKLTPEEVLTRVTRAVTSWMKNTEAGKEAWKASGEDFNIGDLSMYITPLLVWFSEVGLFDVSVYTPAATPCPAWEYDTVLVNREELE